MGGLDEAVGLRNEGSGVAACGVSAELVGTCTMLCCSCPRIGDSRGCRGLEGDLAACRPEAGEMTGCCEVATGSIVGLSGTWLGKPECAACCESVGRGREEVVYDSAGAIAGLGEISPKGTVVGLAETAGKDAGHPGKGALIAMLGFRLGMGCFRGTPGLLAGGMPVCRLLDGARVVGSGAEA